jgi:hypothetical protein
MRTLTLSLHHSLTPSLPHSPPERLLRRRRHGVGLVQDDDLVAVRRQHDLLLREVLDPVAHDVDPARICSTCITSSREKT